MIPRATMIIVAFSDDYHRFYNRKGPLSTHKTGVVSPGVTGPGFRAAIPAVP
jgi:hypothetical protein